MFKKIIKEISQVIINKMKIIIKKIHNPKKILSIFQKKNNKVHIQKIFKEDHKKIFNLALKKILNLALKKIFNIALRKYFRQTLKKFKIIFIPDLKKFIR
jgi:hypothetical protein